MKTTSTLSLLAAMIMWSMHLTAQIPNSGFESWTSGEPDSWMTNNVPTFATPITETTPGHNGSSALKGEVVTTLAGPIAPLVTSSDSTGSGFPVSQDHLSLSFFYKLNVTNTAFFVTVYMTDSGGTPIAGGGIVLSAAASSFTQGTVPIFYSASNATGCVITFILADTATGTPNVGDYFIIDDLAFGGPAGLELTEPGMVTVSPNPASSHARIALDPTESGRALLVYDVAGRVVFESSADALAGQSELTISVADLPEGVYVVRAVGDNRQWLSRLVIVR
jgi:hypothetical protein